MKFISRRWTVRNASNGLLRAIGDSTPRRRGSGPLPLSPRLIRTTIRETDIGFHHWEDWDSSARRCCCCFHATAHLTCSLKKEVTCILKKLIINFQQKQIRPNNLTFTFEESEVEIFQRNNLLNAKEAVHWQICRTSTLEGAPWLGL